MSIQKNSQDKTHPPLTRPNKPLGQHRDDISKNCIECGLCSKDCLFLQKNDTPKNIADNYDPANGKYLSLPFDCSLCQLCAAVCPVDLNPGSLFLAMRREAINRNFDRKKGHCAVLGYEKKGLSKFLTLSAFPENCDTIFFPGCTLPGTRSKRVIHIVEHLQQFIPNIGVMLNCCTKPSHDLGLAEQFSSRFFPLKTFLLENGIKNVIVACPNCYKVFNRYGGPLKTEILYDRLSSYPCPSSETVSGTVTIHDPCVTRYNPEIHAAIRKLVTSVGLSINEMDHHGKKTFCCGEGGTVACQTPLLANEWTSRRTHEVNGQKVLSYCAGCVEFLSKENQAFHIIDLLCEPRKTMANEVNITQSPFTYFQRWRLKRLLKKHFPQARIGEAPFTGSENNP